MIAHIRSLALAGGDGRAVSGDGKSEFARLLRAIFCPSRVEIVKRFEATNRRTPVQLFCAVAVAAVLCMVSTLSPSVLAIWLLWLMATDASVYLIRRVVIKNPASRWDVPLFVAVNFIVCGAWCVMPVILEFRSPVEMAIGLLVLMGVLISCSVIAAQGEIWLVKFAVVGVAMMAPDIADLLGPRPQATAAGVLAIKLLFLFNFGSLIRHWHLSAKREAAMQAELETRRRQAEDLAAAKAMFLAHMSHEIRSPLAGVTLMASLLKRLEDVPEDQRQMIEQIDAGGQAILNLLNAVLDYSKLEAGKVILSPAPTAVRALLDGIANLFRTRAAEAGTRFSVSVDTPLPSVLILDETKLRQIVTNLVSNAIKHSPGAAVDLAVEFEAANETLFFEVRDTGQGVDEPMKKRLFVAHEQQSGAGSGTGLGLAISRGLVELMGGQIGFQDTQGGGATFWFRIPAPRVVERSLSGTKQPQMVEA